MTLSRQKPSMAGNIHETSHDALLENIRCASCCYKSQRGHSRSMFTDCSCCIDCSLLGCSEGRSAAGWVDYNLFGHQIVCHQVKGYHASASANAVDGDPVPVPHFGLALSVRQFHDLADRVQQAKVKFVIHPHLRFEGRCIATQVAVALQLLVCIAAACSSVMCAGLSGAVLLIGIAGTASVTCSSHTLPLQANRENSGQCFSKIQAGMHLSSRL